jgi:6-phosphofructokinase 1
MRIAISTGGGDAPGLNAVIRSAVLSAISRGWDVLGICRGYYGLLGEDEIIPLTRESVRGIAHMGGTILRTTNRGNPFDYPVQQADGTWSRVDRSGEVLENAKRLGIDGLISIGGDGSLAIAQQFFERGMCIVGVPKTIDNDVSGTITTFGFDTAVSTAIEAIDKLHTTAESHDRVIVMEVMGRHAGFIALHAGVAGTADVILIPEIPYDFEKVVASIRERDARGARFSIVVVAEGAVLKGGQHSVVEAATPGHQERLGGAGVFCAKQLEELTGKETRHVVLGHLQLGGAPTAFDRTLATRFGGKAVELLLSGQFGKMVANNPPDLVPIPLGDVVGRTKTVNLDYDLLLTARRLGISFGD